MKIITINTKDAPSAIGPYSQAVRAGGFLFASGQIPIDSKTGEISQDIREQTKQVLKNIKAILTEAKLSVSDVIKTTVFLKNIENFSEINDIYASFFSEPYPARSCVEVSRLPKDVLIEIEFIALDNSQLVLED